MQYNSSFETADGGYSDLTAGERKEYYENGLLKKVTDPEGNITSYTYDPYGESLKLPERTGLLKDIIDKITQTRNAIFILERRLERRKILKEYF